MKKLWKSYSYAIILIVILFVATTMIKFNLSTNHEYMAITIQDGESLWEISQKYKDQHGLSAQQFIEWVEKNNGISRDLIVAGKDLILPISSNLGEIDHIHNLASQ